MIRTARLFVTLVPLLAAGCGFADPVVETGPAGLTRAQFIEVYIELRLAEQQSPTRDAFEARKREILARHSATPEALIEFAEAHGDDVAFMSAVWDSIQARLETVEGDSAAT